MTLTLKQLQDIQAEFMADDIDIVLDKMSLWTAEEAATYFESGGQEEPPPASVATDVLFTRGSRPTGASPWLSCVQKKPAAKYRVVVFSWTGNRGGQGSSHNIRRSPVNWSQALEPAEVHEVVLPGRGTRMKEPLQRDAGSMAAAMATSLGEALAGGAPYAFVGFSFGAVLAWEVAVRINSAQRSEGPALLCAVSAEGPSWTGRAGRVHALDDASFIELLRAKGGTDFILKDAGMTKLYVPVIQADLALEETYRHTPGTRASARTLAFVGGKAGRDKERSRVVEDAARLWLDATTAPGSRLVTLPELDWYVLQEEAGVRAVLTELHAVMDALA